MRAIIVDDESYSADYLENLCMVMSGLEIVGKFSNAPEAKDYLMQNQVDLAFLDIEMPGMNGIAAALELRRIIPGLGIVFVTGYEQYAMDAFRADAVSYLLKPCDSQELAHAVEKASRLLPARKNRMEVRMFGNFSVFIDGQPYYFSNRKAKELLALLVDHQGGIVTMEKAAGLLWENRPYDVTVKQLYRKAVICLNQLSTMKQLNFFVSNRGSCHIIPSAITCDYYDLLAGIPDAQSKFCGEYLLDYSWGENTLGRLVYQYGPRS